MPPVLCGNCGHTVALDIDIPTSPVSNMLGGNTLLSESQVRMVNSTISAARAGIAQIDEEIARLQQTLQKLQHKRSDFVMYANEHISLVAPIRRLPPEILSEIFLHCVDATLIFYHPPRLDRTPLLLGKICSRWRNISMSTPRLWSTFKITIRPKHLKTDVLLAQMWLSRAGTCPLSITLGSKGYYTNSMRPLMQVFLLYCERWCEVRLSLPRAVMAQLSPAKDRLPRLRKLHIEGFGHDTIDIFECAPQLRSFRLDSPIMPSMIKLPWSQLQSVYTGYQASDGCLELLPLTPNLTECALYITPLAQRDPLSSVQLPHLRSITIFGDASTVLDHLLAPQLNKISIYLAGVAWRSTSQLVSLFSRCSIRTFFFDTHIGGQPPPDHEIIQLLQAAPDLVDLDLGGCSSQSMTNSFLTQFTQCQGTADSTALNLIPMLHTMTVDYEPSYFDFFAFADAVQLRMTSGVLKHIQIRCHTSGRTDPLGSAVRLRLHQLREMGLGVRVSHRGKELFPAQSIS